MVHQDGGKKNEPREKAQNERREILYKAKATNWYLKNETVLGSGTADTGKTIVPQSREEPKAEGGNNRHTGERKSLGEHRGIFGAKPVS